MALQKPWLKKAWTGKKLTDRQHAKVVKQVSDSSEKRERKKEEQAGGGGSGKGKKKEVI